MKKLNYLLLSGAALLLASCSQEEVFTSANSESVIITLNLDTPQLRTRVIADGTTANNLQVVIYENTSDEGIKLVEKLPLISDFNKSTSVSVNLLKDHSYSVGVWAYADGAEDIYSVDWEKGDPILSIDYSKVKTNDESLDAFYAFEDIGKATGDGPIGVQLKRPFAQINVGTSDLEAAKAKGYTVTKSSITVSAAYNKFNLKEGDITDDAEEKPVAFDTNNIPEKTTDYLIFPVEGYDYIAMAYVLVPTDNGITDITFTYTGEYDDQSADVEHSRTINAAPVKQNYRTNIFGRVLTTQNDLDVEIEDSFDGDELANLEEVYNGVKLDKITQTFFVSNADGLGWIAEIVNGIRTADEVESDNYTYGAAEVAFKGQTIRLSSNIDLQGVKWTPIGNETKTNGASIKAFAGTFDGAGYTISNLTVDAEENNHAGLFGATNRATIKNVTLKNVDIKGHYKAGAIVGDGYNAKIENCKVIGGQIIITPWQNSAGKWDDANNVGGIAGYLIGQPETAYAKNCLVKDLTISAFRKVGGIAGSVSAADDKPAGQETKYAEISGCTVQNTQIIADMTNTDYDDYASRVPDIGKIYGIKSTDKGEIDKWVKIENNTAGDDVTTEVITVASSNEELKAAVKNEGATIMLSAGDYTATGFANNITIIGTEGTNIHVGGNNGMANGVTFKNVKFIYTGSYAAFTGCRDLTYEDCEFEGEPFSYAANATYKGCTFNQTGDAYDIWAYTSSPLVFDGCTFNSAGKALLIYNEGGQQDQKVWIKDCIFKASKAVAGKAAIEISSQYHSVDVVIEGCTAEGFGTGNISGETLWNVKNETNPVKVTVDGVVVKEKK
ncbi:MAG: hypothetical protein J1F43_07950 [Muribaculaceae bacterium]|nr:hypothetical protein [Muribaculaceae bacterium]